MLYDIKSHQLSININLFKQISINQNPNDPDDKNEHFKQPHIFDWTNIKTIKKVRRVITLEKRAIKDFKIGVNFHSFIPHFLFRILL